MYSKKITYNQLREAVEVAFANDSKIFEFYDPNVHVKNVSEIVQDILSKINGFNNPLFFGIYEKNKLIGYFTYENTRLISFALAIEYRIRKYLREFFRIIKKEINGHFMCLMWKRNIRGVKWLLKNKMEIINETNNIVQLAI